MGMNRIMLFFSGIFIARAVNGAGNRAESAGVTVTPQSGAPAPPSLAHSTLQREDGPDWVTLGRYSGELSVSWGAVRNSWGYHAECRKAAGDWKRCASDIEDASTSTSISNDGGGAVDDGEVYTVRVFAYTAFGDTAKTASDPAASLSAPSPPTAVALSRSGTTLKASWPAVTGSGVSYEVQYSSDSGATWTASTATPSTTSGVVSVDIAIVSTNAYMVRVLSKKTVSSKVHKSAWVYSDEITPATGTAPAAPDAGSVTVTRSGSTLTVSWAAVPGATAYNTGTSGDYKATWTDSTTDIAATSTTITQA